MLPISHLCIWFSNMVLKSTIPYLVPSYWLRLRGSKSYVDSPKKDNILVLFVLWFISICSARKPTLIFITFRSSHLIRVLLNNIAQNQRGRWRSLKKSDEGLLLQPPTPIHPQRRWFPYWFGLHYHKIKIIEVKIAANNFFSIFCCQQTLVIEQSTQTGFAWPQR